MLHPVFYPHRSLDFKEFFHAFLSLNMLRSYSSEWAPHTTSYIVDSWSDLPASSTCSIYTVKVVCCHQLTQHKSLPCWHIVMDALDPPPNQTSSSWVQTVKELKARAIAGPRTPFRKPPRKQTGTLNTDKLGVCNLTTSHPFYSINMTAWVSLLWTLFAK